MSKLKTSSNIIRVKENGEVKVNEKCKESKSYSKGYHRSRGW